MLLGEVLQRRNNSCFYWGEGNKVSRNALNINNTDPAVVKFGLYWITRCLGINRSKVKVQLHLYSDMNVDEELSFWAQELSIKKNQFVKPYIKKSLRSEITQKGFGHGTCGIRIHNTIIKENILMAIKAIADVYGRK